jgi:multimeric flavodoxin WrbA
MNVTIFNGGPRGARGAVCRKIAAAVAEEARTRGHDVASFELDAMAIEPCRGCFACWLKHPGTCAIKDGQERILRAQAGGDILAWISPVTFGGYSSALKKALDRLIPNILPFFTTRQGETRHPRRYRRRQSLIVLGTLPAADQESERIFHSLVRRNAANLDSVLTDSVVIYDGEEEGFAVRVPSLLGAAEEAL